MEFSVKIKKNKGKKGLSRGLNSHPQVYKIEQNSPLYHSATVAQHKKVALLHNINKISIVFLKIHKMILRAILYVLCTFNITKTLSILYT